MMSTQKDGQNWADCGRYCASNIVPTPIQISLIDPPGKVGCTMNSGFSAT